MRGDGVEHRVSRSPRQPHPGSDPRAHANHDSRARGRYRQRSGRCNRGHERRHRPHISVRAEFGVSRQPARLSRVVDRHRRRRSLHILHGTCTAGNRIATAALEVVHARIGTAANAVASRGACGAVSDAPFRHSESAALHSVVLVCRTAPRIAWRSPAALCNSRIAAR